MRAEGHLLFLLQSVATSVSHGCRGAQQGTACLGGVWGRPTDPVVVDACLAELARPGIFPLRARLRFVPRVVEDLLADVGGDHLAVRVVRLAGDGAAGSDPRLRGTARHRTARHSRHGPQLRGRCQGATPRYVAPLHAQDWLSRASSPPPPRARAHVHRGRELHHPRSAPFRAPSTTLPLGPQGSGRRAHLRIDYRTHRPRGAGALARGLLAPRLIQRALVAARTQIVVAARPGADVRDGLRLADVAVRVCPDGLR
jgi:hypothetical protein